MSDFKAIGGVSATLKILLKDRMANQIPVTIAPPDVKEVSSATGKRVNLFLYQVTENAHLKNQEIPGTGHPADYGHPPLALDLHYLLTAYGESDEDEVEAHHLLGDAMRVLHDHTLITEHLLQTRDTEPHQPVLDPSLRDQFEQVKLYLEPISLEDLSKVWTALTSPYRLSAAYKVSVVQIESRRPRRFPRPVGEPPPKGPRVYAVPFRSPQIREIRVRRPGDPADTERPFPYARIGDMLIILGRNFASKATRVTLGPVDVTVRDEDLKDDRIEVAIPDDAELQPGPQPVKVVLDVMMGEPPRPHTGFHSNLAVFMLVPRVDSRTPSLGTVPRRLLIKGERLFHETLPGETLVGPALFPKAAYLSGATPTDITVPLPDTLPAWPVQCLISGTLSPSLSLTVPTPEVRVTIGSDGPHTATFPSKPTTPAEAAQCLQAAIRSASGGGPVFKGTRVTTVDNQLVVVPGGLGDTVTVAATSSDPHTAGELLLDVGTATQAYLSGELTPFPLLTAAQPAVQLTIGSTTQNITLATHPTTLADAAQKLDAAISAGFPGTRVTMFGNQLLIVPAALVTISFGKVPSVDETTVAELQLRARYPVRVRVNGAESIDNVELELPS